jgi:ribosomal protein S18 acetylase RimI-like enzyme
MPVQVTRGGRDLAATFAPRLDAWTGQAPYAPALHSGDIGWHLRNDDEELQDVFWLWERAGETVAVGFVDSSVLRIAVAFSSWGCDELAEEMAEAIAEAGDDIGSVETLAGTSVWYSLVRRGWSVDPDPWVLLYRDLIPGDHAHDPTSRPLDGPADVEARVGLQRAAFTSTFTVPKWEQMTGGPSYDPRFEMVTWTPDGEPAAAATGWFAGPGRCAILEPVGTRPEHRGKGYGTRVNLAVMAALAEAGASGVRVKTPVSNAPAVAAYESCGLRQIDWTVDLTRPR